MPQYSNEKEVCDILVRYIEKRKNISLRTVSKPDRVERNRKAVELHLRSDNTDYYIEHTLIESFPKQIEDGEHFKDLLNPLEKVLIGKLPAGHFVLAVSSGAVAGATETDKIQSLLEKWVLEKAPSLVTEGSKKRNYVNCYERPPNVPFEVFLSYDPRLENVFYIARIAPKDLEIERQKRIRTALNNKCPKLNAAKVDQDSHTVLILECNDIALANHFLIADAVVEEIKKRPNDIPDEIYLVETCIPSQWTIWILKEGNTYFPKIVNVGPYYIDRNKGIRN